MGQPRLDNAEMYVGGQIGMVASMVQFSPTVNQNALSPFAGLQGGLIFRYAGHKVCGLQIELNYMQRGWHESKTNYTRQLDYIELPLLTHLYFGKRVRGFINLGPQIGYCFRETTQPTLPFTYVAKNPTDSYTGPTQQYVTPIDSPFDWGVAGGIGLYGRTRKAGVYQLEARFNYSLGNDFGAHKSDYFSQSHNMNLSLCFAYMWQIKGNK